MHFHEYTLKFASENRQTQQELSSSQVLVRYNPAFLSKSHYFTHHAWWYWTPLPLVLFPQVNTAMPSLLKLLFRQPSQHNLYHQVKIKTKILVILLAIVVIHPVPISSVHFPYGVYVLMCELLGTVHINVSHIFTFMGINPYLCCVVERVARLLLYMSPVVHRRLAEVLERLWAKNMSLNSLLVQLQQFFCWSSQ